MKQHDVIWLAGLLEGEGCFNIRPEKNNQVRVSIEMTDRDVIERAAKLMGSNVSTRAPRAPRCRICGSRDCAPFFLTVGANTKESYQTAIYGERARNLMRLVFPFMGQRRAAKIEEILGSLV